MIASNYRKHPQALALQLPLPWGPALIWHTARPGSRILRKIRAARSHAFKLAGRIKQPNKRTTPQWWRDAKRKARSLATTIRNACLPLLAEVRDDEQRHENIMKARNDALASAKCPQCGARLFGYTPNWKHGLWTTCCRNGHEWPLPIPYATD